MDLRAMNRETPLLALVVVALCLSACRESGYSRTGLPEVLAAESLLVEAGAAQGIEIVERDGGVQVNPDSHEVHGQYTVRISSGTPGQLVSSLRSEVERLILASGDVIYGNETVVPDGLRDFAFRFAGEDHRGFIRVYTATSGGLTRFIMVSYEHRR